MHTSYYAYHCSVSYIRTAEKIRIVDLALGYNNNHHPSSFFSYATDHTSFRTDLSSEGTRSIINKAKKRRRTTKTGGRKYGDMINPSLTYGEHRFLKDLANNKTTPYGDDDKYSYGYKRLLKHNLNRKYSVVMEMAEMLRKVKEEKKI